MGWVGYNLNNINNPLLGVKGSEVQIFSPRLFNKGLTPIRVDPLSFLPHIWSKMVQIGPTKQTIVP